MLANNYPSESSKTTPSNTVPVNVSSALAYYNQEDVSERASRILNDFELVTGSNTFLSVGRKSKYVDLKRFAFLKVKRASSGASSGASASPAILFGFDPKVLDTKTLCCMKCYKIFYTPEGTTTTNIQRHHDTACYSKEYDEDRTYVNRL